METVRMIGQVSGTRNGGAWPRPGETIDLPDDEARDLVRSGMAADVDDPEHQPAEFGQVRPSELRMDDSGVPISVRQGEDPPDVTVANHPSAPRAKRGKPNIAPTVEPDPDLGPAGPALRVSDADDGVTKADVEPAVAPSGDEPAKGKE
jgi:hypothetical protein